MARGTTSCDFARSREISPVDRRKWRTASQTFPVEMKQGLSTQRHTNRQKNQTRHIRHWTTRLTRHIIRSLWQLRRDRPALCGVSAFQPGVSPLALALSGHCATRVSSAAAQVPGCHFLRRSRRIIRGLKSPALFSAVTA